MVVYIDDMYKYSMGQYGRMKMSHMLGTDEDELHEMAQAIGVRRKWYQGDHYDVAMAARSQAVARGAIEVTLKQMAKMSTFRRVHGRLPSPEEAEKWFDVYCADRVSKTQDLVVL